MIRIFIITLLVLVSASQAEIAEKLVSQYKAGKYRSVCNKGMSAYYSGKRDEHLLALTGMACAKIDSINILGSLQRHLVNSPAMRNSATYFSTLLLQKRLIYQFMLDDINITNLQLPKNEHILSTVFEHLSLGDFKRLGGETKMIKITEGEKIIFLSISDDKPVRVLVDEYKGASLLQRHWYQ